MSIVVGSVEGAAGETGALEAGTDALGVLGLLGVLGVVGAEAVDGADESGGCEEG